MIDPNNVQHSLEELMHDGILDHKWVAEQCIAWMGQDGLREMVEKKPDFDGLLDGEEYS